MRKIIDVFNLIVAIIIPLVIGMLSSFITKDSVMTFNSMKKPPFAPPGILFSLVWSILYVLMGISSYIIFDYNGKDDANLKLKIKCLLIYAIQLIFNFFWSIIFFRFKLYVLAFVWLIVLWLLVFALIVESKKINKTASCFLIPYLIWMTFAAYLNIGIAIIN